MCLKNYDFKSKIFNERLEAFQCTFPVEWLSEVLRVRGNTYQVVPGCDNEPFLLFSDALRRLAIFLYNTKTHSNVSNAHSLNYINRLMVSLKET